MSIEKMSEENKQKAMDKLNERQQAFVRALPLCDFIQWKAAKMAGFEGNENVLGVHASRLLRNANIQEAYKEVLSEIEESARAELRAKVLKEWTELSFSDMKDDIEFDEKGVAIGFNVKKDSKTNLIKSLEIVNNKIGETGNISLIKEKIKITYHDKIKALENLSKYLNIVDSDNKTQININFNIPQGAEDW